MPILQENQAEMKGVLLVANAMAVAARTAPKARGADAIETLIVYGDELNALSQSMIEHGKTTKMEDVFARDAGNVLNSQVVVLIGLITTPILWIYGMYDAHHSAEKINRDLTMWYSR